MENIIVNPSIDRHFFQWKRLGQLVQVFVNEVLVAESTEAILLKEVGNEVYDGVYYFPQEDVRLDYFSASDQYTHCPLKGDAAYYSFSTPEVFIENIAWTYPEAIKRSKIIEGRIAFYSQQVKMVIHAG